MAIQFLTITPIRTATPATEEELGRSMAYYPIVGLGLGAILLGLHAFLSSALPNLVTSGLVIAALVLATGALHLDGLADLCDGFYGGKTKDEIQAMMHDAHIGAIGVIGLILILGLKWSLVATMPHHLIPSALLVMPSLGRWAMTWAAATSRYAWTTGGLAKPFLAHCGRREVTIATATMVAIALAGFRWGGIPIFLIGLAVAWGFTHWVKKKIGGMSGDALGAVNEVVEVVTLLAITVGGRF